MQSSNQFWSSWTPRPFGTTYYTVHKYLSNQMPSFSHQNGKYKQKKTGHQTSHCPSRLTFGTTYLYCKIRYVPLRHSRWQHTSFTRECHQVACAAIWNVSMGRNVFYSIQSENNIILLSSFSPNIMFSSSSSPSQMNL